MDVSIGHFCMVFDFLEVGFNSNEINDILTPNIYKAIEEYKLTIPEDWRLIFHANYNNGKIPLVSKNKLGGYFSDKMKYITIVIPIPLKSEIEWGVNPEQHLYEKDHYDKLMKNFLELNVNYNNYNNRTEYITACLKAGIRKALEVGFTVGKMKIKLKNAIDL
jgi:hypothetical protein